MKYNVTLTFNPDELLQTFAVSSTTGEADNQGIRIQNVDLSVEEILEQEVSSWLDASKVYVLNVKEVTE